MWISRTSIMLAQKDTFLLLKIDQLVDSRAGHELLTFMDGFSGYN